jgi:gliding motility-associated-like protein
MTINTSVSPDGIHNINCSGASTGFINVSALNSAGSTDYRWSDGFIGSSRTDIPAGIYKVIITDGNNCQMDSTVTLTEPGAMVLSFEVIKPFCQDKPDGQIALTVTGGVPGGGYTYLWSDNSTGPDLSNIPAGKYEVIVTDRNGCSQKATKELVPENDICLIIPEAFSPNGDLINDVWNIGNIYLYPEVEVTIYNRWGERVWKSARGYPDPWDGRSNGIALPIDSYHYAINLHNGTKPIVGDITIVR